MLIGLNALRTNREKSAVLNAWFDGEEEKPATQPVTVPKHNFASVEIRASFRSLTRKQTTVPSLPRHAQQNAPRPVQAVQAQWSPYQAMSTILDANSRSSRWLAQYGLLQQFASTDCLVDMSMTPDGGMSAVLRSPYGYRRTVVCRPDGSVSQRITGPQGEEIVRFNNDGDPVHSYNKAQPVLQIA
jgi:hypothetical protein